MSGDKPTDPKHVEKAKELVDLINVIVRAETGLPEDMGLHEAIATALQQAEDDALEWQPMETAKLDKEPVLLLTTCHGIVEAWFCPGEWERHHEYGDQYTGACWVCADDAFQIEVEETTPMHHGTAIKWMPLPAPPKALKSTEESK